MSAEDAKLANVDGLAEDGCGVNLLGSPGVGSILNLDTGNDDRGDRTASDIMSAPLSPRL